MNSDTRESSRRLEAARYAALALIVAGLALIAYRAVFGFMALQDDEGYVIVSLREFIGGSNLYGDIYSQYGPGLFTFVGGLFDLTGLALTSDGARFFNLALWLLTTLLIGVSLLRITRSFPIAATGMLVAFGVLIVDANEPLHPGAAIGFLLAALVAAISFYEVRPALALGLAGACVGALLSLKINVGAFALVSIALACALMSSLLRRRVAIPVIASLAFAVLPMALMSSKLDESNTLHLALITTISALSLILVGWRLRSGSGPGGRELAWFAAACAAVAGVAALGPILAGTSPGELVDGWLVRPSRTPGIQFAPVPLGTTGVYWSLAGFGAAVATALRLRNPTPLAPRSRAALGAARLALGLLIWLSLAGSVANLPDDLGRAMAVAAPFAWVAAVAPEGSRFAATFPRLLIVAVAILQVLHGFPVPGSQFAWGQLLYAVVGGICVADGVDQLAAARSALPRPATWRPAALACVIAFAVWFCLDPLRGYSDRVHAAYDAGAPVDLPGAEHVRQPADRVQALQALTGTLGERCETFLTLPGLNSFYLYTGQPPPTVYMGPWPWFLESEDQRAIVRQVRDLPSLCVVYHPLVLAGWGLAAGAVPDRPLTRFIDREFRPAGDYGGYELRVRR